MLPQAQQQLGRMLDEHTAGQGNVPLRAHLHLLRGCAGGLVHALLVLPVRLVDALLRALVRAVHAAVPRLGRLRACRCRLRVSPHAPDPHDLTCVIRPARKVAHRCTPLQTPRHPMPGWDTRCKG